MKVEDVCGKYGLPCQVMETLEGLGIAKLYPPQIAAIEKGALDGETWPRWCTRQEKDR